MIESSIDGAVFDSHDNLMAKKGFYYALYMSQFKGKGPGGEVDTSGFVST